MSVDGLYDQRLKRPSIRRELRKRCQQEGLLSPRIRKEDKLLKHHVEYDLLNHPQQTNWAGRTLYVIFTLLLILTEFSHEAICFMFFN